MKKESSTPIPGYPDRSSDLDAHPGFKNPPPGYGEVPFWWWSGDDLDPDRLLWQIRELHKKGISGVQVNYSHADTPGWLTDCGSPGLFTDDWWQIYTQVSEECGELGMGIGLSTYTVDWPNGAENLFYERFYKHEELHALRLVVGERQRLHGGESVTIEPVDEQFAARAYEIHDGLVCRGGVALDVAEDGSASWTAPNGEWEIWRFGCARTEGSLNALMPDAGETVIRGFYQQFEDHSPGGTGKGLNYFFNDELHIGEGKFAWHHDFAAEFARRKGYDLLDVLPALWTDMGPVTPKVRMDYADVRMSLMEERYFKPIFDWHTSRGIIYGCDNNGRGLEPAAYGDYFRATRWYSAPGHDTPGGLANLIKGKVSSSIASLYELPRVQLEGYHSLGWGATTERIMEATCENYLYGCNMLSLHGCYYTTRGSHWEWAPPCFHFRMPYWEHMGVFLKYFERLSYLMSQGHHACDVAVMYPVAPYEAEMDGQMATDTAFEIGRQLVAAGIDFTFIDHQSLAGAAVRDDTLTVKNGAASYRVIIFPNMQAARWHSVAKAAEFAEAGGQVLAVGALPEASDRVGANDTELETLLGRAFLPGQRLASAEQAVELVRNAFVQDVRGLNGPVRATHRRIGFRDVYLVMGANPGDVVEFRARGKVELWDPWTGESQPLPIVAESATGTQVALPLESSQAQVVVFTPGEPTKLPRPTPAQTVSRALTGSWQVRFEPTMNNRFGDFRLPITAANETIGLEARRFRWQQESAESAKTAMLPETDDTAWRTQRHGHGLQFYRLGPIPETNDVAELDARLATLESIEPTLPVTINGQPHHWQPYDFSWREGREDDAGHQGFHGLKGTISENFIRLGKLAGQRAHAVVLEADTHNRNYLWSSVQLAEAAEVTLHISEPAPAVTNGSPVNAPAAVFIDGQQVADLNATLSLSAGSHSVLLRYEDCGESHVVLRRAGAPTPEKLPELAMPWYADPAVIRYAPLADTAEWFRFLSAPGTTAIQLQTQSREPAQAWCNGQPMRDCGDGKFEVESPAAEAALIALRLLPETGCLGGAAIPEPILVKTNGEGTMPLGDWSELGILNNYSGGVCYQTNISLTEAEASGSVQLDLGRVVATAEVLVNGELAGIRVAPPWKLDLSGLLQAGQNTLTVRVFNTLSNHYQTSPSRYRGDPVSGLIGPVSLILETDATC